MTSHRGTTRYCYDSDPNAIPEESNFSGLLHIFVHHARNIHNICIYDNQDVYAKFSLTYNPDEAISTRIINGGGKNPDFNEKLAMKITRMDAVLKCEIWMLSRAKHLLEDQLLGFTLVPIALVAGKGKFTEEFGLSSTDLFHSPAGTVKLSLSLNTYLPLNPSSCSSSSITSEVVFLDRKTTDPVDDYSKLEFPDINTVHENQQMVSQYFNLADHGFGSFLHLGGGASLDDSEMTLNSSENLDESVSTSSGLLSSTATNLTDDSKNTADSIEKKTVDLSELDSSSKRENANENANSSKYCQVFSDPIGKMDIEAEQSAMQQQIVDMYMKSMHQFTESLAKMKLPINSQDKPETENTASDTLQNQRSNKNLDVDRKKDGSRVFYGSRAFF